MAQRKSTLILDGDASGVTKATAQASQGVKRYGDSVSKAWRGGSKLMGTFRSMHGRAIAAGAAIAGVGYAVYNTIQSFSDFQTGLTEVSTLFNATEKDIQGMSDAILKTSAAFGEDAITATRAYYDIVSAGAKAGSEANTILFEAAKGAKAGVTDIGTAADALTSVLNAYGLSASSASKVNDVFFGTVKAGKTTFGELAGAIGRVAPLASAAGVSMEQMFAAIAETTKVGINTNEAMTGMKATIQAIMQPSSAAKKAAKELGIEFSSQALKAKGLTTVLSDVAKATGGNAKKIGEFFASIEAQNVVLAVTKNNAEGLVKTTNDLANSQGAAAEAATKMQQTINEKMSIMGSTVAAITIKVGEHLVNAFNLGGVIDDAISWIRSFAYELGIVEATFLTLTEQIDAQKDGLDDLVETYRGAARGMAQAHASLERASASREVIAGLKKQMDLYKAMASQSGGLMKLIAIEGDLVKTRDELIRKQQEGEYYDALRLQAIEDLLPQLSLLLRDTQREIVLTEAKAKAKAKEIAAVKAAEEAAKKTADAAKKVADQLKAENEAMVKAVDAAVKLTNANGELADSLNYVWDWSIQAAEETKKLDDAQEDLKNTLEQGIWDQVTADIDKLIEKGVEATDTFVKLGKAAEEVSTTVTNEELLGAARILANMFGGGANTSIDRYKEFTESISQYAKDAQSLWKVLTNLPSALGNIWDKLKDGFTNLVDDLKGAFKDLKGLGGGKGFGGFMSGLGALGGIIGIAKMGWDFIKALEGPKRAVLGVSATGYASSRQTHQTETAASGLVLSAAAERVGADGVNAAKLMLQNFLNIDKALTEALAALGYGIDLSGTNLFTGRGTVESVSDREGRAGERYGIFGTREFDAINTGALDGALLDFVQQWVIAIAPQIGGTLAEKLQEVAAAATDPLEVLEFLHEQIQLPAILQQLENEMASLEQQATVLEKHNEFLTCLLYTSPSPRDS